MDHDVCVNAFRNLNGKFWRNWSQNSASCMLNLAGPMVHGNCGHQTHSITLCVSVAKPFVVQFFYLM
jgi:hypothetical protein